MLRSSRTCYQIITCVSTVCRQVRLDDPPVRPVPGVKYTDHCVPRSDTPSQFRARARTQKTCPHVIRTQNFPERWHTYMYSESHGEVPSRVKHGHNFNQTPCQTLYRITPTQRSCTGPVGLLVQGPNTLAHRSHHGYRCYMLCICRTHGRIRPQAKLRPL